ncbi:hypothetical protein [Clostridium perfringens]|uniref:hypothetical protein n=1 Tax=Clostridium perfringens TaxID=1502 RepID=UPI0024BD5540|nr:hypothetical protein [Clostridium perfringens]
MKANKKTLMVVKNYLKNEEGYDLDEVISDIVSETNMLKAKEMGDNTLSIDECSINWGDDEICVLEDFINDYTNKFIDKICNVLDSFVGEDIDWYLEEDE